MTSIPVPICRLSDNNFKRLYLQKKNTFSKFLIVILNCGWNLQCSENQEEYSSLSITEIIASERDVYLNV